MPAKLGLSRSKKRNNKQKSSNKRETTTLIHHSSPALQPQGLCDLNFQEKKLRVSAMEDSLNGKVEETREAQSQGEYKDVVVEDVDESKLEVESVKNVEINDVSEPANKREISIFEKIVDSGEKILDVDDSSSSSSSSSDEKETKFEEKSPQVEENSGKDDSKQVVGEEIEGSSPAVNEESTLSSLVENDGIPSAVEDLVSKGVEVITSVVSGESEEERGLPIQDQKNEANDSTLTEEVHSKGIDENPGESFSNEHAQSPEIPENGTNPSVVPVTRDSLQPTSWTSCCGLFEVLRRSDR